MQPLAVPPTWTLAPALLVALQYFVSCLAGETPSPHLNSGHLKQRGYDGLKASWSPLTYLQLAIFDILTSARLLLLAAVMSSVSRL